MISTADDHLNQVYCFKLLTEFLKKKNYFLRLGDARQNIFCFILICKYLKTVCFVYYKINYTILHFISNINLKNINTSKMKTHEIYRLSV